MDSLKFNCFSEPVDNCKDSVISLAFRKWAYEVNSDDFPRLSWWFKWMKGGFVWNSMRFGILACFTSRDILFDIMTNIGPPVVTENIFSGFELFIIS